MGECIFCKIVNKEIPVQAVYEDQDVLAFNDIAPQAPVHILVIPKKHITSAAEIEEGEFALIASIFKVIQQIAVEKNISQDGYRVVNNCREMGGQTVGHLHFHLLGGRQMQWPPG
ncbi:MAG: histidine triad nucleotide-binding protein [Bacillota bacterium]